MKTLSYSVQQDRIVLCVKTNNKQKEYVVWKEGKNLLFPDCYTEWNSTISDAIQSVFFKLRLKHNKARIEIIRGSNDSLWDFVEKIILYKNDVYVGMFVLKTQDEQYNRWDVFDKVFSELGYVVEHSVSSPSA